MTRVYIRHGNNTIHLVTDCLVVMSALTDIKQYLCLVRWVAVVIHDSVSSYGSDHGAPLACTAVYNSGRSNCTYKASLQLEKTLGKKQEKHYCITV